LTYWSKPTAAIDPDCFAPSSSPPPRISRSCDAIWKPAPSSVKRCSASSRRLAFQLLVESLTLSFLGGVLGVALSFAAVKWIHLVQPKNVPRLDGIAVNGEVLLFTTLLCLLAGVLFGLAPALGARHVNPGETLVAAGRGSTSANPVFGRGHNLRRLLVVAQVALSMVLLIGAGLLVRSFARLQNVAPGFDPSGVLTLELTLTGSRYAEAQVVRDPYRDPWTPLEGLPGLMAAGGGHTRVAWPFRPGFSRTTEGDGALSAGPAEAGHYDRWRG